MTEQAISTPLPTVDGARDRLIVVPESAPAGGLSAVRRDPRPQIVEFDRPWGHQEVFTTNESTTVKILTVVPGARLSLQRHAHRDEMWIILDEGVRAVVGETEQAYPVGSRVWVPRGTVHRLLNNGEVPARVMEISFGDFDECDIERLQDDFARA